MDLLTIGNSRFDRNFPICIMQIKFEDDPFAVTTTRCLVGVTKSKYGRHFYRAAPRCCAPIRNKKKNKTRTAVNYKTQHGSYKRESIWFALAAMLEGNMKIRAVDCFVTRCRFSNRLNVM